LLGNNNIVANKIKHYLANKLEISNIEIEQPVIDKQENFDDCGVFTMLYLLREAADVKIAITQKKATESRSLIKSILLDQIHFNKGQMER
jgi:Ulp1 family protease